MSEQTIKKTLYLGTSLGRFSQTDNVVHYPVIRLIPKKIDEPHVSFCLDRLSMFSHVFFTSQNSVSILWDLCADLFINPIDLLQGKCFAIGPVTSQALQQKGVNPSFEALEHTQEGMIKVLQKMIPSPSYVFYPRSSLARAVLKGYLVEEKIPHEILDLYDTVYQALEPKPSLEEIGEIFFTSPSTVEGFFRAFSWVPKGVRFSFQGVVTQRFFEEKYGKFKI